MVPGIRSPAKVDRTRANEQHPQHRDPSTARAACTCTIICMGCAGISIIKILLQSLNLLRRFWVGGAEYTYDRLRIRDHVSADEPLY